MTTGPGTLTEDIYWAAQDPRVQAVRSAKTAGKRYQVCRELALQGIAFDVPVCEWGWDPVWLMKYRKDMGYLYVASSLVASIPASPSVTPQKLPVPAGYILVSTDAKDYPAFRP